MVAIPEARRQALAIPAVSSGEKAGCIAKKRNNDEPRNEKDRVLQSQESARKERRCFVRPVNDVFRFLRG